MEYQKIYNQIIERARIRQLTEYKERHHIIPKCMGGLDVKDNLVNLTAKEHFLCHKLLCEIYPKNDKLKYALFLMATNKNKKYFKYKISGREYERLKIEFSKFAKGKPKPKGFGDKIKSIEKNKKIGLANSKPKPKGFGDKISKANKGIKRSDEWIENYINKKSKPIIQYDKQGEFIKEWKNAVEASISLNINKCTINAVARNNGINKTAGGYIWKYK